jgi:hypothetical protein
MWGRHQWVLIQVVIDHLGQDVHTSSPIAEHMTDLELSGVLACLAYSDVC